ELGLELEAFHHARFDAGVVVADGQLRQRLTVVEQGVLRRDHGGVSGVGEPRRQSRCLTPACSSCSSFSVTLMRSWLKASIGRPSTTLYLPFSVVTGKPNIVSFGMPYWPSEGMPIVTHLPFAPSAQSRMWSIAA